MSKGKKKYEIGIVKEPNHIKFPLNHPLTKNFSKISFVIFVTYIHIEWV